MRRKDAVYLAKLALEAARYEEALQNMKIAAYAHVELTDEERRLLSLVYKNVICTRRVSWAAVNLAEVQRQNKSRVALIKEYRRMIETEVTKICDDMLEVLDKHLFPFAQSGDAEVFYHKMKVDYYRYLDMFGLAENHKSAALEAYRTATEVAQTNLPPAHPLYLRLALGFSAFYYYDLASPDQACNLAMLALDNAVGELDTLSEDSYRASTYTMRELSDCLPGRLPIITSGLCGRAAELAFDEFIFCNVERNSAGPW